MIFEYGFSLTGKSHIEKGIVCQDSHRILKMDNGWYIAAVADGVGSAAHSEIGSRIAVDTVVEFCNECMPWDYNITSIKSMMRTAYNYALKKIIREAERSGNAIESYDTTLSMVIYDGQKIVYGHSGDGGILGLTVYGEFVSITKPQKGSGGTVVPLRAGYTNWVFDTYEEKLAAVLLVTDGVLEALCPYLLKDTVRKVSHIYVPLGSYFADPKGIPEGDWEQEVYKRETLEFLTAKDDYYSDYFYSRLGRIYKHHIEERSREILEAVQKRNYPVKLMQAVNDDKTIVALIHADGRIDVKPPEYYKEPNWKSLQEEWKKTAYPQLHTREEQSYKEGSNEEPNSYGRKMEMQQTPYQEGNGSDGKNQSESMRKESSANDGTAKSQKIGFLKKIGSMFE